MRMNRYAALGAVVGAVLCGGVAGARIARHQPDPIVQADQARKRKELARREAEQALRDAEKKKADGTGTNTGPAPGAAAPEAAASAVDEKLLKKAAQEAAMRAWLEAAAPNENHQRLDQFSGAWDAKASFYVTPGEPPQESDGSMVSTWQLDGRFLRQEYTSTMMNLPMKGLGYFGYDNMQQAYLGLWMDTFGTGCLVSTGQFDPETNTWTMLGETRTPAGVMQKQKQVLTVIDADSHSFDFYMVLPDGSEAKQGRIVYTRHKEPAPAPAAGETP